MRTGTRILAATAGLLAVAALLARRAGERPPRRAATPTARPIRVLPPDTAIAGAVEAEQRLGDYLIRIVADSATGEKIVDIRQGEHRVFAMRAATIRLEAAGRDITGEGVPNLVVHAFTGGAHCCFQATVLGLGPSFREVATIDGADDDVVFTDLDGDGRPEVKVGDWRFAYWRDYPFVETVVPEVILKFRDGAYRPACDLMRMEAPDDRTLRRRARELSANWTAGDPPPDLLGYVLELVYGGHADLAWRFLDLAWPGRLSGKADFLRDLSEKLAGSPCWSPPPQGRPTT